MKKTKTLLAVALATAAPAVAGPHHDHADPWRAKPPVTAFPSNVPPELRAMQAQVLLDATLAVFGVVRPRQLPSGAPACGNVQSKMPRPASCDEPAPAPAPAPAVITAKAEIK